jgi:phosphatidate phosphatase LPIN
MNYVRSITGSVSKGWNSINPATLSGAIDAIVVEREDGSLACSPFHVRFGKYQILRPSDKKVEFRVNGELQDYAMKLGEGGEAFFVFETSAAIPAELQTSPIASPASSPEQRPIELPSERAFDEPEPLDLDDDGAARRRGRMSMSVPPSDSMHDDDDFGRPRSGDWSGLHIHRANTDDVLPSARDGFAHTFEDGTVSGPLTISKEDATAWNRAVRSTSPPPVSPTEALARAIKLSKKLFTSNIPNKVTESGDLELDMTGYKSSEEEALRAEVIARKILSDEIAGDYDIGALIGADENGNLWIYSSEESKAAAMQKTSMSVLDAAALQPSDAVSDPGYQSDSGQSDNGNEYLNFRRDSDSALGMSPPHSPEARKGETRNYAKTLRLTSDQLKALDLKPGANTMSFTVNRSTCNAYMFFWKHDVPILISDIDGTITKSDALGHVLNMIGRDWTHQGVDGHRQQRLQHLLPHQSLRRPSRHHPRLPQRRRARLLPPPQRPRHHEPGPHHRRAPPRNLPAQARSVQNGVSARHHAAFRQAGPPNALLCRLRQSFHRRAVVPLRQHPEHPHLHHQLQC